MNECILGFFALRCPNKQYTLQGVILKLRSQVVFISNPTKAWGKHKELRGNHLNHSAEQLISQNIETYTSSILVWGYTCFMIKASSVEVAS